MRILITGATGYIGRRLLHYWAARREQEPDIHIRVLVRSRKKLPASLAPTLDIIEGSTFETATLRAALSGVDTAYYLVHSMASGGSFAHMDRLSAKNFIAMAAECGVGRVVYLGGLGGGADAGEHLKSREETGHILNSMPERVPLLWFRAGVIIGSGSASFEIIRNLVEKLPVMTTPRWVRTMTQPIGVRDVIRYLGAAADVSADESMQVDIGAERMSFQEMMAGTARVLGLSRRIIPVPLLSPRVSSWWLMLMTPVPISVAQALVEGLKTPSVAENTNARLLFPDITPASFAESVRIAVTEIEEHQVESRWCDSSGGQVCDVTYDDVADAVFTDRRVFLYAGEGRVAVWRRVLGVGGKNGWFASHFLWRVRGAADKLIGGYGLSRGRREADELRVGDSLDFWKVVDLVPGRRLLLLAQMKVPGRAWLEFSAEEDALVITAYFYPRGLWGRAYWYAMMPFHGFVFSDMGKQLVRGGEKS